MSGEIDATIVKLKKLLSEKYGEDFRKFYLVNHPTEEWSGLITSKSEEGGRIPGTYYKIKDEDVVVLD